MKTALLSAVSTAILCCTAPASADESTPQPVWYDQRVLTSDFAFSAYATNEGDGKFSVQGIRIIDRKTGQAVQEIGGIDGMPCWGEAGNLVGIVDANFDGRPDITFQYADGGAGPNSNYHFYLFDPRSGRFEFDPVLSDLTQVGIGGDGTITSASRGGCCQHYSATYRYVGGKLLMVSEVDESLTTDGKWIETSTRRMVNGKWKTNRKRVRNPDGWAM
ncbi:hypothetical protein OU994_05105 [Pseudoduganella sp. SL102]|uniref:XAC2610-related protein n=1 Tax=Pseudoduganella sp. SL102 TaxID=2995154 RepID=UPI00248BA379|nr:hypothetical protein [Pseudoduganella sp. SL102]WBS03685.1 hypothetical protein OU994_05105 [Pseudoduganella sp. SL102]